MSFFAGASNIKIVGGEFNDIKGNYTVFDHSRHETNIDSSNIYNNKIIDSYNDNSKRFSGVNPRSRLLHDVEGGNDRLRTPPTSAGEEDPTGPPSPHHPQFMPPQISSAGGNVTNINAFNRKNNQINDVFNDNSQTHYYGRGPPTKQRRDFGRKSIHEEEEDLQSNSGSLGSGQNKMAVQTPFHARLSQRMGGGSGPLMTVDSPHIQTMSEDMRRNFAKLMKYTQEQTESIMPGNSNVNDDSDDADSASLHSTGADSITPGMNNLSIKDGYLSPPTLHSRNKSDPQITMQPTIPGVPRQIGSSGPSSLSPYNNALQSRSNPSLAPHMKEKAMVNFLSQPAAVQQVDIRGNNDPNRSPPAVSSSFGFPPSSGGGPVFRTIHGDVTKYDTTVHKTNINSFNTEENTIQNAFNDNSLVVVESSEKPKKAKKKIENTTENDNSAVDTSEKEKKGEKTEKTISDDDSSAVDSSETRKKGKKRIENTIENDNFAVDFSGTQKGNKIESAIQNDNSVVDSSGKQKKRHKILGIFAKK